MVLKEIKGIGSQPPISGGRAFRGYATAALRRSLRSLSNGYRRYSYPLHISIVAKFAPILLL